MEKDDEKKSLIKDENIVTIQGWMLNRLKLKGTELIVYATLWGFTQRLDNQWFFGTRQYLATWAGTSRVSIDSALKNLIDKKLVEKKVVEEKLESGKVVKYNHYRVIATSLEGVKNLDTPYKETLQGDVKKLDTPYKESLHIDNIDIYIDNNIEENIDNKKEKSKKEKPLISEEHESLISSYTENEHLKEKIKDFILDRKDRKKPVTVRALEMLLKKLTELAQTDDEKIAVINQSIECGYQGFFEVKGGYKNAGEGYYNSGITAYHGSGEKPKVPECYKRGLV